MARGQSRDVVKVLVFGGNRRCEKSRGNLIEGYDVRRPALGSGSRKASSRYDLKYVWSQIERRAFADLQRWAMCARWNNMKKAMPTRR